MTLPSYNSETYLEVILKYIFSLNSQEGLNGVFYNLHIGYAEKDDCEIVEVAKVRNGSTIDCKRAFVVGDPKEDEPQLSALTGYMCKEQLMVAKKKGAI